LEFLARAIKQEDKIKGIQIGKKGVKLSLFTDDIILYQKTSRHHKHLQENSRIQINLQKSVAFLYTNNEQIEKKYKNNSIYNSLKKNQIPRNRLSKGCE
jgi:hypothetical protein